jgi:hypothetical protein
LAEFSGPIFIVGMPRSGTKLLRELLNRHPSIAIPDVETEFLPWMVNRVKRLGDLADRRRFERLYRRLAQQSFFVYRRKAGLAVSAQDWYSACRTFDAAGLFEALIRLDVGAAPGSKRIWGDKSPSYIDDLTLIGALYPQARVLHIVRDVRDYCASVNRAWGKDMRRAAHRWALGVAKARRDGIALGGRYSEVRYEDLLRNPQATLTRVCHFLGLEFRPDMLLLTRSTENLGEARGAQHVVADNHGKFMTRIDDATLADIEQIAVSSMREFGYEPVLPERPPSWWMPIRLHLAQLHDGLQLIKHRSPGRGVFAALVFHLRYFVTTRG